MEISQEKLIGSTIPDGSGQQTSPSKGVPVLSTQATSDQQRAMSLMQAMQVLSAVNRQKKFAGAAIAFCNEAAAQWQCERVSLGFLKGRYVQLKAVSHTEGFSRKMKIVRLIESAMEESLDQDIEVLAPAPQNSTYISRSADMLSKEYSCQAVLSLPLRQNGEVVAVVTLERPAENIFSQAQIETLRLTCELCTARLCDLYENDRWLGAIVAARSRNFLGKLVGPRHAWMKLIAILCCCAIIFLILGKGLFRCEAPFVLEATVQQVIPAPFDGYIESIEVEIGKQVEAGKTVLGKLDTADLQLRLAEIKAEKAGYEKEASAAMRDGQTAKQQIAEAQVRKVQAQIELLEYQIGRAELVCPISGVIVQGDLKRKIGAPVKTGDILFEVCPLQSLRAQLLVPEEQIYDIKEGQNGFLAAASYPGLRIPFIVERINPVAEVVNQRNVFKVRVQLLETQSWMRPGMEGVAKVSVGKRHYVWIWSRKIVNWVRMKLWV
jgi:hypothetical protein